MHHRPNARLFEWADIVMADEKRCPLNRLDKMPQTSPIRISFLAKLVEGKKTMF
jgi:hypothetical protein